MKSRRNLRFSEDSDLSCDDVLERSSQKSRTDVSHACHSRVLFSSITGSHLKTSPQLWSFFCVSYAVLNPLYSKRHTDIFDLVSGIQKETIKEEKAGERKRQKIREREKEREKERERGRDLDRVIEEEEVLH